MMLHGRARGVCHDQTENTRGTGFALTGEFYMAAGFVLNCDVVASGHKNTLTNGEAFSGGSHRFDSHYEGARAAVPQYTVDEQMRLVTACDQPDGTGLLGPGAIVSGQIAVKGTGRSADDGLLQTDATCLNCAWGFNSVEAGMQRAELVDALLYLRMQGPGAVERLRVRDFRRVTRRLRETLHGWRDIAAYLSAAGAK